MEQQWFEVRATLTVQAADEDDAINRVAGAIRHGYREVKGMYPVGTFDARPTDSPIRSRRVDL